MSCGLVKNGHQPDAKRAARCSAASESPPIQIGRCGFWTGFGSNATFSNDTYLPSKTGESLVHSSMIAARYSSLMRPRSWNGTPRISNSFSSHPTPKVASMRPLLSQSRVASAFAVTIGCCSGRIAIEELMRIRFVAPAK